MVNKRVAAALDDLTQTQRERLFYIEVKAFFCGDLTRADIERRFGVKPAASARDLSTYRRLAPQNLFYDAGQRKYATTDRFAPLFEHSAERVLTWFRAGFGDNMDQKLKRTVPCESASDLVKPDIETLATLTRAIAGRRQVKVNYLSLSSGASTKTLCPLALADTGLRWHLRAFCEKSNQYRDFVLSRFRGQPDLMHKTDISAAQDSGWTTKLCLEFQPDPRLKPAQQEVLAHDYQMQHGQLHIHTRACLAQYILQEMQVNIRDINISPEAQQLVLSNIDAVKPWLFEEKS